MDVVLAEVKETAEPPKEPWGLWTTLGLSLLVILTFFILQTGVVAIFFIAWMAQGWKPNPEELESNGLLLSSATWITMPLCLALVALFVKLRRSWSLKEYLALGRVSPWRVAGWCLITAVLIASAGVILSWGDLSLDSSYMVNAYQTAYWLPLFWAALLIAAPLFEEIFFRGFMFRGIQNSLLGVPGATVITALAWSLLHIQYNGWIVTLIFLGGVFFGIARWASGSVFVTIAMHFIWNLISLVETACSCRG
jgi:membrane protease YdiL (CAAX protease family)